MRRWSSVEKSSSRRSGTTSDITEESARIAPRIACSASRLRGRALSVVTSSIIGWTCLDSSFQEKSCQLCTGTKSDRGRDWIREKKLLPQQLRFPQLDCRPEAGTNEVREERSRPQSAIGYRLPARSFSSVLTDDWQRRVENSLPDERSLCRAD